MKGFIWAYPDRPAALRAWPAWAAALRRIDRKRSFGIVVRQMPGSRWWALCVEPLTEDRASDLLTIGANR